MDLSERMTKTVPGQVTWANPDLGKKCIECGHALLSKMPSKHRRHVCQLVRAVTGRNGELFDAQRAIACSKFFPAVDTSAGQ